MNATECFENHQTSILYKFINTRHNEEIVDDHCLAFMEFHSGTIEVEIHVQAFQELGDRVTVCVRFLLNDFDQILEGVATGPVDDNGGGQIAKDVWAHCLNGVQVKRFVQKHFNDEVATFWMIEECQHTPVDQPGPLLESLDVCEVGVVDVFT